jgi:hypothetical protein
MRPDRWWIVRRIEPAELMPLRHYLPWDFEWDPPAGWCRVSYEPDGLAKVDVLFNYCRWALDALSDQLGGEP